MKSENGKFELNVPRDRNGSFKPQIVKKNQITMSDEIEKRCSHFMHLAIVTLKYPNILKIYMA